MNLRGMPSSHTTEEAVNLTPLDQYIAIERDHLIIFWVYLSMFLSLLKKNDDFNDNIKNQKLDKYLKI